MGTAYSPCQIVLAEDNPADVALVREALREHQVDCQLRVLCDGDQVLSFIDGMDLDSHLPSPDLLLLDMHLPKRDGGEVLKYLRASERCGQTPVVILSSSDAPSDYEKAAKNAALYYFRKPSTLAQLLELGTIVKEVIRRAQTAHPASAVTDC